MSNKHKMISDAKVANRTNIMIRNSDAEYIIDIDQPRDWAGDLQSIKEVAIRRVNFINARETEMEDFYIRAIELSEGDWINL